MLPISQKTFLNIVGGYSSGNILTPKECYLEKESTLLRLEYPADRMLLSGT